MNAQLLDTIKRNHIIDQLEKLDITEKDGQKLHEMTYQELKHTLTMAKWMMDEDVRIESSENDWF